jgi:hypothetical protein
LIATAAGNSAAALVDPSVSAAPAHAPVVAPVELDRAGTDPNDIMVFFGEIDRACSSFGEGQLAPPVASV